MAKPRLSAAERREAYLADKQYRSTGRPEEESSPGNLGSTPSEPQEKSGNVLEQPAPSPAPSTEPPSSSDLEASSSADSAAGGTPAKPIKVYGPEDFQ